MKLTAIKFNNAASAGGGVEITACFESGTASIELNKIVTRTMGNIETHNEMTRLAKDLFSDELKKLQH